MSLNDEPFQTEIEALDENFSQFAYDYQYDWLQRGQINFRAIQSLWDVLNNVWDNLDELGINLNDLDSALQLIEVMNGLASDVQKRGEPTEEGIIFAGTREEYDTFGSDILARLYELEPHVNAARQELIRLAQS